MAKKKKDIKDLSLAERQKKTNDVYREESAYQGKELCFSLDLPLSVNHMYVRTRHGGQRLSKLAEEYIIKSRAKVLAIMEDANWKKICNASWYYLDLVVYMPDKKRRDSHNMLKLLLDTLQEALYHDDYYVMPRIQAVELDRSNPRVEIVFKPQSNEC